MSGSSSSEVELDLTVTARQDLSVGVIRLDLARTGGGVLPEWQPGAHIDVTLQNGATRQYSLCGDPTDRSHWSIGVLLETNGRGGSRFIHENARVGNTVSVRGPRNHFALVKSKHYVFIAGGIGITPILPMIGAAHAAGADWRLVYGGRAKASMAFLEELSGLGERVSIQPFDQCGLIDLDEALGMVLPETAIYACGPEQLLAAIEARTTDWPPGSLHLERFAAKPTDSAVIDSAFEVELANSGRIFNVPPDKSIMEVLETGGVDVLYSCRMGVCGSCETRVLSGAIDHRDSVLDDMDRGQNDRMIICVSRGCGGQRLVLDL